MNHWTLVGRDIMWFVLGSLPLYLACFSVTESDKNATAAAFIGVAAFGFQWLMIALLYYKVIV